MGYVDRTGLIESLELQHFEDWDKEQYQSLSESEKIEYLKEVLTAHGTSIDSLQFYIRSIEEEIESIEDESSKVEKVLLILKQRSGLAFSSDQISLFGQQ